MNCKYHQSPCTCRLRSHQSGCTQCLQESSRLARLRELCRDLEGVPGYRLHPLGLAIETVGDVFSLSQEKAASIYNRMERGFLARNAKAGTLRAKPCPCRPLSQEGERGNKCERHHFEPLKVKNRHS